MTQLHRKFSKDQIIDLLKRYLKKEIDRKHLQAVLGIGKARFFTLLRDYRKDPAMFNIEYNRKSAPRLSAEVEKIIVNELTVDRNLIKDPDVPLRPFASL